MNVIEFNPGWKTDIAFCFVDNTRTYQSDIREFMKNQADGTLSNIYNKGWTVYQWVNEDALIKHASDKGHKWAVVFSTGTEFINGAVFFDAILKLIKQDFFIAGHILDRDDAYYELHHQCYVINLEIYKQSILYVYRYNAMLLSILYFIDKKGLYFDWLYNINVKFITLEGNILKYFEIPYNLSKIKTSFLDTLNKKSNVVKFFYIPDRDSVYELKEKPVINFIDIQLPENIDDI